MAVPPSLSISIDAAVCDLPHPDLPLPSFILCLNKTVLVSFLRLASHKTAGGGAPDAQHQHRGHSHLQLALCLYIWVPKTVTLQVAVPPLLCISVASRCLCLSHYRPLSLGGGAPFAEHQHRRGGARRPHRAGPNPSTLALTDLGVRTWTDRACPNPSTLVLTVLYAPYSLDSG